MSVAHDFGTLFARAESATNASAQAPVAKTWVDLKAKRDMQVVLHQEFTVAHKFTLAHSDKGSIRDIAMDLSQGKWREHIVDGSEDRIRVFDGDNILVADAGGEEFTRIKPKTKMPPEPGPYSTEDWNFDKAKESERRPCGFTTNDHTCVVINVPLKDRLELGMSSQMTRATDGAAQVVVDTETGAIVAAHFRSTIDDGQQTYFSDTDYLLKQMAYGADPQDDLFKLPANLREVKELTPWSVSRIKKELIGKPAPELTVKDMQGNQVSLASLKGKIVLLDFWATWCGPCLADAPSIDKLYMKYGGKNLAIIGISESEDRATVETFLKKHPHEYTIALTSDNEMPRQYQVGAFPTYIVIAPDGTIAAAVDGDQGFGELRKFLQKAGLSTD